jgi:hypothetical protein
VEVAQRIEKLCRLHMDRELDSLVSGDEDATALLARILAAVRTGVPDPEGLDRDLDALETFAASNEIDGLTTSNRRFERLLGGGRGPVAHVSQCPNGYCSRREIEYGAPSPVGYCAILDKPLDRVPVDL